jgi:hypothetical protein
LKRVFLQQHPRCFALRSLLGLNRVAPFAIPYDREVFTGIEVRVAVYKLGAVIRMSVKIAEQCPLVADLGRLLTASPEIGDEPKKSQGAVAPLAGQRGQRVKLPHAGQAAYPRSPPPTGSTVPVM